jgi:DNA-binding transcriptional MocR family regulator
MAAAFPRLKAMAEAKGLPLHHLGAGYPHPEVSDPTAYIAQKEKYFRHVAKQANPKEPDAALRAQLMTMYGYTDTLGPVTARRAFAQVYGHDFDFDMNPDFLVPTVGSSGGISLMCSLFERSGDSIAYLVDAPTYTGFVSRAGLCAKAAFYSVDLDDAGPNPERLRAQIRKARQDGRKVAFYYTVPDGHNPGGISFTQARRQAILEVIREEETFIVEDAPYTYISYESAGNRPKPFIAMDPTHAVHLFTASKIGLPGPRVAYFYSEVEMLIHGGHRVPLRSLVLTEASGDTLFCNPEALRGFEAFLHDENMELRKSLWPVAREKCAIYGENRAILLQGLEEGLAGLEDHFGWTKPGAGFFSVFTFLSRKVRTTPEFVEKLVSEYGVVTIPMFGFYPDDARDRDPEVGLNQLRLSFCFSEHIGEGRREDMRQAVRAFTAAVRKECGL